MAKLLHPGNMHSIRLPALDLLLEFTKVMADHIDFHSHITLLQASVLTGIETIINVNDDDMMVFGASGEAAKKFNPKSSGLLNNLRFTKWENEPSECLAAESPLTVHENLEMIEMLLTFASKVNLRDTDDTKTRRSDSVGGKQDENLQFAFWTHLLAHDILSAFFPVAGLLLEGCTPPKFNELKECPLCVHLVLERWLDGVVESGGAGLDIIWSGDLGAIIEDSLSERFAFKSVGDEDNVRIGLAFRTVAFYNKLVSGSGNTPKSLTKNMASTSVLFATHAAKLLLQMDKPTFEQHDEYETVMEGIMHLFDSPFEKGLLRTEDGNVRRLEFERLLLNLITNIRARPKPIGLEYTTRLVRALFKTSARVSLKDVKGEVDNSVDKIREWIINSKEGGGGMPKIIVIEWREILLVLTKMLIYHLALQGEGAGRIVEAVKKNSRWVAGTGNWLKCTSASECFKILNKHLHMISPEIFGLLDCRLHTLASRAVADAVRIWINEAIVPERHYKPPPRRGANKEHRNMSKERAKNEEFDLASPLIMISPGTIMKILGPWMFAAADCKGKGFREGRIIALETLVRILVTRTFRNLGDELEGEIILRMKESFEVEGSSTLIAVLRMMGEVFLSETPGVCSLIEDYIEIIESLLGDNSGNVLLGEQTKTSVMNSLSCITTLLSKFGDVKTKSGKPLKSLKMRVGEVYIKFASNQKSGENEWLRLCASGLFHLMVNEISSISRGGGGEEEFEETIGEEEFNLRDWTLTLCDWCNSPNDYVAFAR